VSSVSGAKPGLDAAIASFEKATGAKVTVSYTPNLQYQAAIRTQLTANTAPDVFYVWPGNGNTAALENLAPGGYLTDLSKMSWNKEVPKQFAPVTEVGGKRLILPMAIGGYGVMYNEDAVKAAGATIPRTWSEVMDFCDAAKSHGKVAFALGAQTVASAQVIAFELAATLVYGKNPKFQEQQDAGKVTFSDSNWKRALDMYLTMEQRDCFNSDPVGTSVDVSNQELAKGDALAQAQHTAQVPAVEALAAPGTHFGYFALPATNNPAQTRMPAGSADGYAINSHAKDSATAKQFIEWLAKPSVRATYASKTGALPALAVKGMKMTTAESVLNDYFSGGKTITFMDQLWPNSQVTNNLKVGVQNLLSGQANSSQVLASMDSVYK
jgi:raffinose/stachyose/melibiose transport system substrate-binding protein